MPGRPLDALTASRRRNCDTTRRNFTPAQFTVGAIVLVDMAQAAEIRVMASAAIREAYLELVPVFERTTAHRVLTTWVPTVEMMRRLKASESIDLVIMASSSIDELIEVGRIVLGSRTDLATSGIGVAVRTGAPQPNIGSAEALRETLLSARSVAYSTGPSGVYLAGLFQRMGIADELRSKVKQVQGEPIGAVIARGEAEIGFQQVSELLPIAGITYLGALPAEIQQTTVFSAGLHIDATDPAAAQALVKFLTSPAAVAVIKKKGMEPCASGSRPPAMG